MEVGDIVQNNKYTEDYGVGVVYDILDQEGDLYVKVHWAGDRILGFDNNNWWRSFEVRLISEV